MTRKVTAKARNAFKMLSGMGYTPHVAAGLVGNLMQESGWDINTGAVGDNGNTFRAVQWNGPRKRAFKSWASQNGYPETGIGTQILYLDHEMKTSERGAYDALASVGTVRDAAVTASRKFWRPGDPRNKNRARYAEAVMRDAIETGALSGGGGASQLQGQQAGDNLGQSDLDAAALREIEAQISASQPAAAQPADIDAIAEQEIAAQIAQQQPEQPQ